MNEKHTVVSLSTIKVEPRNLSVAEDMQAAYFEAMLSTERPYKRGPWLVEIEVSESSSGSGMSQTVTISYEGRKKWVLHVYGRCNSSARPCLETALRTTHTIGIFNGGRGQKIFHYGDHSYTNLIGKHKMDSPFDGRELIRLKGEEVAKLSYMGGPL